MLSLESPFSKAPSHVNASRSFTGSHPAGLGEKSISMNAYVFKENYRWTTYGNRIDEVREEGLNLGHKRSA